MLLPGPHDVVAATAFAEAINQIFLMFHDAPDVILALKYFHESISEQASSQELRNQRLLELFKSMAKHLEIETDVLGEGFFMRAFTVNSLLPPQSLHLEFNVVQLLDGQPVLTGWQFFSNSQKAPIVLPAQAARLLACALLELAALAAERDQDLRSGRAVQIGELGQDFVQRVERRRAANA